MPPEAKLKWRKIKFMNEINRIGWLFFLHDELISQIQTESIGPNIVYNLHIYNVYTVHIEIWSDILE